MHILTGRKAVLSDLDTVSEIYEEVHDAEEMGRMTIGWIRGVYPTRTTASEAFQRGDLFVFTEQGTTVGTAVINHLQMDAYERVNWHYKASEEQVMVLHTLAISPRYAHCGYGKAAVGFYEAWARRHGCPYLRIDTNLHNTRARKLYQKLGYSERGVVECQFNGMHRVPLLMLEKYLSRAEK